MDGGPALPVAADRVLLISDITLDTTGTPVPASPIERMQGREGALVLLNGQHQPAIPAIPQATQMAIQQRRLSGGGLVRGRDVLVVAEQVARIVRPLQQFSILKIEIIAG